jgi:hypothetical protein
MRPLGEEGDVVGALAPALLLLDPQLGVGLEEGERLLLELLLGHGLGHETPWGTLLDWVVRLSEATGPT